MIEVVEFLHDLPHSNWLEWGCYYKFQLVTKEESSY
jgi:hypothetical protein